MKDYLEGRIVRLETCFLGIVALLSGEITRTAKSPEELKKFEDDIDNMMEAIKKDIR